MKPQTQQDSTTFRQSCRYFPGCPSVWSQLKGFVKEPNMFHNYETEKITRKASDAADVQRITLNASCMTILGGRTEQHVIIAGFLPRQWLYERFSRVEEPNKML